MRTLQHLTFGRCRPPIFKLSPLRFLYTPFDSGSTLPGTRATNQYHPDLTTYNQPLPPTGKFEKSNRGVEDFGSSTIPTQLERPGSPRRQ